MKKKSIGINAVLNTIKSALSLLFPLISYPYAVRVLRVEGMGKVNYAESIISYFALIAGLGISTYAVREGAKIREDRHKFERFAGEVFSINLVTTLIAYSLLFLSLIFVRVFDSYIILILISSLSIIFTTLGIDWVNTIYEDFLFITIRSIISHIITLAFLFIFVHDENDLYFYAFLTVITNGIICISNLFYCRKYINLKARKPQNIKTHLIPMLTLFANNLAISIYVNADTTMLGWLTGDYYVGLYSAAVKIYKIIKSILVAVYSVTIPRLSHYIGIGDTRGFKKLYTDLLNYLTLLLIPAGAGLVAISNEILLIIAGEEYIYASLTLQILGVSIIFAILGGAFTNCLNITLGREKVNMKATIISACVNFALNLLLIPLYKQNGAALTTVLSEFIVFIVCYGTLKQKELYIDLKLWRANLFQSIIGASLILAVSYGIKLYIDGIVLRIFIIIPCAVAVYAAELALLKNLYLKNAISIVIKRLKR